MQLVPSPLGRLRTRLEERLYDTTAPRPIRVAAAGLSWRLRRIARPAPVFAQAADASDQTVVVYFAEGKTRIYQLEQWLPVLEKLSEISPVLIVTRTEDGWRFACENSSLPAALVPTFRDLSELYERVDPKLALYVNNGWQNFQSLGSTRMLHVHINHGESDKLSMVSNQGKAYDRIFVAGEAAVLRHRAALLDLDERKLVRVGRPQLDLDLPPELPATEDHTVLYAPTWEGENEANNYTSIDIYGPAIAAATLATPGARLIYKPHPRIATSKVPEVLMGHESVVRLITEAARKDPAAGHQVIGDSTNILALLKQADLLVSDVSSVTLDFLYLRNERPLLLTDRRSDREQLQIDAPISRACDVIDATSADHLPKLIGQAVHDDAYAEQRQEMRRLYFGELQHGESTARFLEEVAALLKLRDEGIRRREAMKAPASGALRARSEGVDVDMEETA